MDNTENTNETWEKYEDRSDRNTERGESDWQQLAHRRILITGASGMIGSCLIALLMEKNRQFQLGLEVVGVSRDGGRAARQLGNFMEENGFTYVSADINQPLPDLGGFDYIIHGASNTHPRAYASDPIGTITANVIGTKHLLDYAVAHSCERFVFLSSVEIYGENRGDTETFSEEYLGYIDCNTMRSGYPESKRLGESLCNAYHSAHGLDFVIPRLSRVYGPGLLSTDTKAISQFLHKAAAGEDIVLKSKGDQLYSYTYSVDCARAILFLMMEGQSGNAYNVSDDGSVLTLAQLAEILAKLAGTNVVFELPDALEQSGYSKTTKGVLAVEKLTGMGFVFHTHIREGLKRTLEYLQKV